MARRPARGNGVSRRGNGGTWRAQMAPGRSGLAQSVGARRFWTGDTARGGPSGRRRRTAVPVGTAH